LLSPDNDKQTVFTRILTEKLRGQVQQQLMTLRDCKGSASTRVRLYIFISTHHERVGFRTVAACSDSYVRHCLFAKLSKCIVHM